MILFDQLVCSQNDTIYSMMCSWTIIFFNLQETESFKVLSDDVNLQTFMEHLKLHAVSS